MVLQNLYIRRQSKLDEAVKHESPENPNPGAVRGSQLTSVAKVRTSQESVRTSPTPSPYRITGSVERIEDEEDALSHSQAKPGSTITHSRLEDANSMDLSSRSDGMGDW